MGLKDDIEAMERHSTNGTLREWFQGTAPRLDDPDPPDRSVRDEIGNYEFLQRRGE